MKSLTLLTILIRVDPLNYLWVYCLKTNFLANVYILKEEFVAIKTYIIHHHVFPIIGSNIDKHHFITDMAKTYFNILNKLTHFPDDQVQKMS